VTAGTAPARFKDLCLDATDHQALADWWCATVGECAARARSAGRRPDRDHRLDRDRTVDLDQSGANSVRNRLPFDVDGDRDALLRPGRR
jgi:hypothetical protein